MHTLVTTLCCLALVAVLDIWVCFHVEVYGMMLLIRTLPAVQYAVAMGLRVIAVGMSFPVLLPRPSKDVQCT